MHIIWKRKAEFEDFIRGVASEKIEPFGGLYVLIAAVESYFELIVRVLLDKIGLSKAQLRKENYTQKKAIDELYNKKLIDEESKNILHEVRELRNDMLHDVLYKPDLNRLQEFMQKYSNKKLDPADEYRCSSSSEELERIFCHQIVTAYAKISNKYKKRVDKKIADYLNNP